MRVDPLFGLTFLGLLGCATLAVLHPTEAFDPADPTRQVGRNVHVDAVVLDSVPGADWVRGRIVPTAPGQGVQGLLDGTDRPPQDVAFVWFRPPETPILRGDRLVGRAIVEADGAGVSLLLDGADAARIEPGPFAVEVRWPDLVRHPEAFAGRIVQLRGVTTGDALVAPGGRYACPLGADVGFDRRAPGLHAVLLERLDDRPGWHCRLVEPSAVRPLVAGV